MTDMTDMNTLFASLITTYPTYEAFETFLRSAAGGRIQVKSLPGDSLVLLHYEKGVSDLDLDHVRFFRSVVWNKDTHRPVSAGPQRGYAFSKLRSLEGVRVEEAIDGVMVNQFHDGARWRLATHTNLGATRGFYGRRSFAELFLETQAALGITESNLNPTVAYSWVLQHPEERVISPIPYAIPRLFLVQAATFDPSGNQTFLDLTVTGALKPRVFKEATLEDTVELVSSLGRQQKHAFAGISIRDSTGTRYKLRATEYELARHLRGNQAKHAYTWMHHWGLGNLFKYLEYFPEEKAEAELLVERYKAETQEIHKLYLQIYRDRAFPLGQAPHKYRKLLFEIHQARAGAYFPSLRTFMNGQDVARKVWLLNYREVSPEVRVAFALAAEESKGPEADVAVVAPVDSPIPT
jgi:hypothetical protein